MYKCLEIPDAHTAMPITWDDIVCTEPVNTESRKEKCTLTLRSSADYRLRYIPPDGQTLKEAAMHMESQCLYHPKCNPKIRGPMKVCQQIFIGNVKLKGTRYFKSLSLA